MAKKTEPWPLLQDIVPAPRSPDTSKVLNFAAIVYKKGRESCFFARSCFLWIKPVGACFKTNWFCFSFQLETYIKPVGFASQNQLVWGWSWAKVRQFDACKGLHGLYVQIIAVFRSGIGVHQGGCLGLADCEGMHHLGIGEHHPCSGLQLHELEPQPTNTVGASCPRCWVCRDESQSPSLCP